MIYLPDKNRSGLAPGRIGVSRWHSPTTITLHPTLLIFSLRYLADCPPVALHFLL